MSKLFSVLCAIAVASIIYWFWGLWAEPLVCVVGEDEELFGKTAEFLSGILDLTLALSTSLVSLGAALLIGLHTGIRLTVWTAATLLAALIALAQSAGYGVLWKLQLANLWFNECYNLIASPDVQWLYQSHFVFLIGGIVAIAVLVAVLSLNNVKRPSEGG
ncbi:MAG: hypothetical protein ACK4S3_09975 [Parvibaculum sp.]